MEEEQRLRLMELAQELKLYADTINTYCHVKFDDKVEQKVFLLDKTKRALSAAYKVDKHIETSFKDVLTPQEQDFVAYDKEREKILKAFS